MIKTITFLFIIFLLISCNKEEHKLPENFNSTAQHKIVVVEKIDAGSYTYLNVKEENFIYWIAVPKVDVNVGEILVFNKCMEMKNFKSETLNRTFETILFVEGIRKEDQQQAVTEQHSNIKSIEKENIELEPLKDGYTIAQIYLDKESLNGKIVKVHGKVVKYNEGILNKNWIHLQDGTGTNEDFDLVITTDMDTQLGKIIVAEGKLVINKDIGSGYTYKVIIEDAKVKIK